MSDGLMDIIPTVIVGGLLIKTTSLLLDEKKGRKRKSMSLLDDKRSRKRRSMRLLDKVK